MATRTLLTADEYLARPGVEDECSELVRGEVRPVGPSNPLHNVVAGNLFVRLWMHVREHRLGRCFTSNAGFHLPIPGAEGDTVRSPDVAFASYERLPALSTKFAPVAPDLVVEVLSPSQTARDLDERMDDYFAAGTRLLWVIDPERRTVAAHSPTAPTRRLRAHDTLDGGEVVPGFTMPVAELFVGV